jgi:hypothetical protein
LLARSGEANGYGTVAVDLAAEASKLKEMKAQVSEYQQGMDSNAVPTAPGRRRATATA